MRQITTFTIALALAGCSSQPGSSRDVASVDRSVIESRLKTIANERAEAAALTKTACAAENEATCLKSAENEGRTLLHHVFKEAIARQVVESVGRDEPLETDGRSLETLTRYFGLSHSNELPAALAAGRAPKGKTADRARAFPAIRALYGHAYKLINDQKLLASVTSSDRLPSAGDPTQKIQNLVRAQASAREQLGRGESLNLNAILTR